MQKGLLRSPPSLQRAHFFTTHQHPSPPVRSLMEKRIQGNPCDAHPQRVLGKINLSEEVFWECEPVKKEIIPRVAEEEVRGLPLVCQNNLRTATGMQTVRR